MADQDSAAMFGGFEDPNFAVPTSQALDDAGHTLARASSGSPTGPKVDPDQQFTHDTSVWSYQDTSGYDFNFAAASSAGPSESLFQTAPWELPFDQEQQDSASPTGPVSEQPNPSAPGVLSGPQGATSTVVTSRQRPRQQNVPGGAAPFMWTPAQQEQLRNIAMPPHLQYQSPTSEPSPGSEAKAAAGAAASNVMSSPDGPGPSSKVSSRKRKSSAEAEEEEEEFEEGGQPIKKTAHNMIEKRYRTNLNDKIAALRDSVPSLRIMSKSVRGEDTTEDREELHGLTPAHKLNKATVLSKATEYIRHLEKRNSRLLDENNAMQARIAAFEKLFMAGAMNGAMSPMQQPPTPMQYPQDNQFAGAPMTNPRGEPATQGMIQVPDDMKRILSAQMAVGQPYPVPQQAMRGNPGILRQQQIQQQQQQQLQQGGRWSNAGPYFGKLMVGSLAGLMVIEAVRTEEQSNDTPEGRGLFALPAQLLRYVVGSNSHIHFAGHSVSALHLISHLKFILFFGLCLWVFVPSLFAPSSKKQKQGAQAAGGYLEAAPSPASPIHVRRQAWLTAIQTVWVPQHNFFLEAAALILKTMKLSLRNTIGIHGYQMLTGLTEEQEAARVKAWSIALDAQLAGGDVEINKSRLTLTLLASGTLPDTPLRLMLKALHIRVLLWDLGSKGLHNIAAAKLARSRWNDAKQLKRVLAQLRRTTGKASDDDLPEHLAALLEYECDDVLNSDVIRRAYNLAWNLPTTENVVEHTDGMDDVVFDHAVRSPMDAVAAWWSSQQIQRALTTSLGAEEENDEATQEVVKHHVDKAQRVAPIGSAAQARAQLARAVLVNEKRGASIAAALQIVEPTTGLLDPTDAGKVSTILNASTLSNWTPDVQVALSCAMAIAHLQRGKSSATPPRESIQLVEKIVRPGITANMSLLGCASLFKLMVELHGHPSASDAFALPLERLAGSLRIWIGSTPGERCGVDQDVRHLMVDRCLEITKAVVGMEMDTGYGSMSECEEEVGC